MWGENPTSQNHTATHYTFQLPRTHIGAHAMLAGLVWILQMIDVREVATALLEVEAVAD